MGAPARPLTLTLFVLSSCCGWDERAQKGTPLPTPWKGPDEETRGSCVTAWEEPPADQEHPFGLDLSKTWSAVVWSHRGTGHYFIRTVSLAAQ